MTPAQILLIKRSWNDFRRIDPIVVGDAFYSKLFTENPALKKMFPNDMETQYWKLMEMLNTLVSRLEKLETLSADLEALAIRHVKYGVRPGHYKMVGQALLWTLRQGLGSDWGEELDQAWKSCYSSVAEKMIAASTAG